MEKKVGLVLCGGGAKGAYQMGALQAFEEEGYFRHLFGISGVSIGALNELFLCSNGCENGVKVWKEIQPSVVFDMDFSMIDQREGFFSRQKMRELLYQYIQFDKIRTSTIPLYIAVTSVSEITPEVVYYKLNQKTDADIVTLMEATSALPIIYEDVQYEGTYYRDGGLIDNMPIKPLYDAGCRTFLVISLSADATIPTSAYPDAEFYLLRPYRDLGGLFSGTLNFTKEEIAMNLKLGYKDGKRFIKAFLEEDKQIAMHYDMYAQLDYEDILVEMKQQKLQAGIDEKLDYMANIMKKYDV